MAHTEPNRLNELTILLDHLLANLGAYATRRRLFGALIKRHWRGQRKGDNPSCPVLIPEFERLWIFATNISEIVNQAFPIVRSLGGSLEYGRPNPGVFLTDLAKHLAKIVEVVGWDLKMLDQDIQFDEPYPPTLRKCVRSEFTLDIADEPSN